MTEKYLLSITEFYNKSLTNGSEGLVDYKDNFVDNLRVVIYIAIGKSF